MVKIGIRSQGSHWAIALKNKGKQTCIHGMVSFSIFNLCFPDAENGFSASGPDLVVTSDNITLHCGASVYNYSSDIGWYYRHGNTEPSLIHNSSGKLSFL